MCSYFWRWFAYLVIILFLLHISLIMPFEYYASLSPYEFLSLKKKDLSSSFLSLLLLLLLLIVLMIVAVIVIITIASHVLVKVIAAIMFSFTLSFFFFLFFLSFFFPPKSKPNDFICMCTAIWLCCVAFYDWCSTVSSASARNSRWIRVSCLFTGAQYPCIPACKTWRVPVTDKYSGGALHARLQIYCAVGCTTTNQSGTRSQLNRTDRCTRRHRDALK